MSGSNFKLSRREFLSHASALAAGGAVSQALGQDTAGPQSVVVDIRSDAVVDEDRQVVFDVFERMLNTGLMRLTGKRSVDAAWREFVSPGETVGLKFNGVSRNYCQSNECMLRAIARGLARVGIREESIVPIEDQLRQREGRFTAPEKGFDRTVDFGAGKTQLKKYLTRQVDVLINLPDLKHHHLTGVTAALKNVSHGVISNPGDLHYNCCDPYIAYINALPVILQKRRLNICNAIRGVFDDGPLTHNPQLQFKQNGLLLSTDPVALDTISRERVEAARRRKNMRPLRDMTRHIDTAASLKLGTSDRERIDLVAVTLDAKGEEG